MDVSAQSETRNSPFFPPSSGPHNGMMLIYFGESNLLDLLHLEYRFKCYSLPETLSQTHPEVMFYRLAGIP